MAFCRNCGKEIDKESAIKVGKMLYYCSDECKEMADHKRNNKANFKSEKNTARRELTDLIQQYYRDNGYRDDEINWNLIGSQIKNLTENYEYKYTGIRYCDVKDLTFKNVDRANRMLTFEQNKTKGHSSKSGPTERH